MTWHWDTNKNLQVLRLNKSTGLCLLSETLSSGELGVSGELSDRGSRISNSKFSSGGPENLAGRKLHPQEFITEVKNATIINGLEHESIAGRTIDGLGKHG